MGSSRSVEIFKAAPGSSTSGSKSYFLFKVHDPTSGESGRQQQLTTRLSSCILDMCAKRQPRDVAACFTVTRFIKTPHKVYIFWKLRNCRFRLLVDLRQEIKTFPKIALIFQKYIVSQIEFILGQNLTRNYVFFAR